MGTAVISVVSHNCPHRIPMSGIFWRMLNLSRWIYRRFSPRRGDYVLRTKLPGNMGEEAEFQSMKGYCQRDLSAIKWTLESLTDNTELEPFIEGIHGFTVSRDIPQSDAIAILIEIFSDDEFDLGLRIDRLLISCDQILELSLRQKRRVACLSALWTMASLSVTHKNHLRYHLITWPGDEPPDWFFEPTIEAHWAQCVASLLFCILLAEDDQPEINASHGRWSRLLAFLSNISTLNSFLWLGTDIYQLNLSEYRMLALISFLVAPLAGPFDPIATSQHPHLGDSFYRPLLSAATHQLTMANVQPQIQLIFAGL